MTVETLDGFIKAINNTTQEDRKSWRKYVSSYKPFHKRYEDNTFIIFQKGIDKETIEEVLLIDQHNIVPVWFEYILHLLESGDVLIKAVNGTYSLPTIVKDYAQREMFFYKVFKGGMQR